MRDQARGEGGPENGKVNVGGAPGVVMIAPGICARANGEKTIAAFGIGDGVASTSEMGVQRGVVLIVFVEIAASRVSLPELDERVRDGTEIFVKDLAADDDTFAERGAAGLASEVGLRRLSDRF